MLRRSICSKQRESSSKLGSILQQHLAFQRRDTAQHLCVTQLSCKTHNLLCCDWLAGLYAVIMQYACALALLKCAHLQQLGCRVVAVHVSVKARQRGRQVRPARGCNKAHTHVKHDFPGSTRKPKLKVPGVCKRARISCRHARMRIYSLRPRACACMQPHAGAQTTRAWRIALFTKRHSNSALTCVPVPRCAARCLPCC
jgi:hypothetical protein